jgi:putative exosortase-associated protein (TIGR04073 family)
MNTLHRFLVAGLLTSLSLVYTSTAVAEQPYQEPQYQQQYQQPKSYGTTVRNKAVNGFINLTTAPLEIPKSWISDINAKDSNIVYGAIGGTVEGLLQTAYRASAGVLDLATFLIPTKPIVQPQYVWDDFYETPSAYGDIFRLDNKSYPKPPHFELPEQTNPQPKTVQQSGAYMQ